MPRKKEHICDNLEFRWYDFVPIIGLLPSIIRNKEINPQTLTAMDTYKTIVYAVYHASFIGDLIIESSG